MIDAMVGTYVEESNAFPAMKPALHIVRQAVSAVCYRDNDITFDHQTMLVLRKGQAPLLRLYRNSSDGDEDWLAPLSEEPVQRADAILLSLVKV